MPTPLRISALDGYALGARRYGDQSAGPYVVIAGATAVKQAYYARFAAWLALQGATVLTFDYRGVGDSRPHSLRRFDARMRDWGDQDLEAVLRFALSEKGERPLHLIGHSVGGQLLGLAPSAQQLSRIVTVASQSGNWRHWSGLPRLQMLTVFFAMIPLFGNALGYVPGWLGMGEDLPGGIALEWAKWARHPDYLIAYVSSREDYAKLSAQWLALSIDDDTYAPRAAVDSLHALYSGASIERRHLTPKDVGALSIGHFGFFRSTFEASLWAMASQFLLRPVEARFPTSRPAA